MKSILILFLTGILLTPSHSMAQQDSSHKYILLMQGTIYFGKKRMDNASLEVMIDSAQAYKTFTTDSRGRCSLDFPLQHFFTIKISKRGFVTKIITVDAHVPRNEAGNYLFSFSANLFEDIPELDVSALKHPVAKVFFNTFLKKFDYDYNYTISINNDIKKMYDDYSILKNKGKH